MSNELGQLASGVGYRMKSGQKLFFIHKNQVHVGRKATYANAVCDCILFKYDPYCVRLTVRVNRIIY